MKITLPYRSLKDRVFLILLLAHVPDQLGQVRAIPQLSLARAYPQAACHGWVSYPNPD